MDVNYDYAAILIKTCKDELNKHSVMHYMSKTHTLIVIDLRKNTMGNQSSILIRKSFLEKQMFAGVEILDTDRIGVYIKTEESILKDIKIERDDARGIHLVCLGDYYR